MSDAPLVLNPGDSDLPQLYYAELRRNTYLVWSAPGLPWREVVVDYLEEHHPRLLVSMAAARKYAADASNEMHVHRYFDYTNRRWALPSERVYSEGAIARVFPPDSARLYQQAKKQSQGRAEPFRLSMTSW